MMLLLLGVAGCAPSHVIKISLVNTSTDPITNIVVDYPNATFGRASLVPDKPFDYSIKATGDGPIKVEFTNAAGTITRYQGLSIHKDETASIELKFTQQGVIVKETKH